MVGFGCEKREGKIDVYRGRREIDDHFIAEREKSVSDNLKMTIQSSQWTYDETHCIKSMYN